MSRRGLYLLLLLPACAGGRAPISDAAPPLSAPLPLGSAAGLWPGLAAAEDMDWASAGRAWSDLILAGGGGDEAIGAAELLGQLPLPFRARSVARAERGALTHPVRARLAWTGHGVQPTHWLDALAVRRAGGTGPDWTARVERGGRLRVGGGWSSGRFVLQSCARFERPLRASVWMWTNAEGVVRLNGEALREADVPSVDAQVVLQPGLHVLRAELAVDAEDDELAIWWPGWAERVEPCGEEEPADHRAELRTPPEPEDWPARFVALRRAEGGVGAWPRRLEALLGEVPRLAPDAPALMGAWARWALELGTPAARVLDRLDGPVTPWGQAIRARALAGVDPARARTLLAALDDPRESFGALLRRGRQGEALALVDRLDPESMTTADRTMAASFFSQSGWPKLAARFTPELVVPLAEALWRARVDSGSARQHLCPRADTLQGRLQCAEWSLLAEDFGRARTLLASLRSESPGWAPVHRLHRRLARAEGRDAGEAMLGLRRAGELRLDWELKEEGPPWRPPLPFAPSGRLGDGMRAERGAGDGRVVVVDRRIEDWLEGEGRLATTHVLERVQTRGGIDAVGQVTPPPDAAILRVRTLNGAGPASPAELQEGSIDLSFVDLDPMDGAEVEWISAESTPEDEVVTRFSHQGRHAVEFSELVIRTPVDRQLRWVGLQGAPEPFVAEEGGRRIHRWRFESVPPWREEPHGPPARELLPLTLVWIEGAQARARKRNIEALELPPSPWAAALGRRLAAGARGVEALRRVFDWVEAEIEPGAGLGARALLERRGDRTRLLAQMTEGLGAHFVLGRGRARWPSVVPDPRRYDEPLVLAELDEGRVWMGFDGPSSWFGRLPADFRGGSHLEAGGSVRVFRPEDLGPEHLDVVLRLGADGADAEGRLELRAVGRWRGRLDAILDQADANEVEAQLERGLSELLGAVDVVGWSRTPGGLQADFAATALFEVEGRTLRMRRIEATPLGTILLGLPGPEELMRPARRRSPLCIEERSERLRLELDLAAEAALRSPPTFARGAGWGRFMQRFEETSGTFALERRWSWSSVRVPPEDMPSFVAAMERLVDDTTVELAFVLQD